MAADVNRSINIEVNSSEAENSLNRLSNNLEGLDNSQTKVTQSTRNLQTEHKNLNKGLLDNGGAVGLLAAATGGLSNDFKDAVEAIELTGVSLKGLRGAIIATGIGALAIIVLELVTNWSKWKGIIDGSTTALENFNKQSAINTTNRDKNNLASDISINNLENELKLLQAQGASTDKLTIAQQKLDAAKKETSKTTLDSLKEDLVGIESLIKLEEKRTNQLAILQFNIKQAGIETINTTTTQRIENVKNAEQELAGYLATNPLYVQKLAKQKEINAAQINLNNAINDPKVATSQSISAARDKEKENSLKRQQEQQNLINKILKEGGDSAKLLQDINKSLRDITVNDLSPTYNKFKLLTDKFYELRNAVSSTQDAINKLSSKKLNTTQNTQLDELKASLSLYQDSLDLIKNNLSNQVNERNKKVFFQDINNIQSLDELKASYDQLNNSIMDYERVNYNAYAPEYSNKIERINLLLKGQKEIIQETFNLEDNKRSDKVILLQKEIDDLEKRRGKLGETKVKATVTTKEGNKFPADLTISQSAALLKSELAGLSDGIKYVFTNTGEELINQYFDLIDKVGDFTTQINDITNESQSSRSQLILDINAVTQQALVEQERLSLDARYKAQENYANSIQILQQNGFSFLSQLQNSALIEDVATRNILLVAQKGAEIAQVVIGTIRENSKLKQQAGDYAGNAALYGGLAASFAPINPILAASYAGAATNYAVAGSRSLAQIGVNYGIAGASIAGIVATTITSWNKSAGGGGGGNSAGGGGSGSPQFNIVGSSGNNQLAAQIANQQNMPVRAYVVGSDVSTQQAYDRNIVKNSTFL
jgi:hypothetical protein